MTQNLFSGSVFYQDVYQVANCQGTRDGKQVQQNDVQPAEIRNHDWQQKRLNRPVT
jgi:hypothetical protein